jgi:hypothetical protein
MKPIRDKKIKPRIARLNKVVFGVALLWLATSLLLLLFYRPATTHAIQPSTAHKTIHYQFALAVSQAARASFIY